MTGFAIVLLLLGTAFARKNSAQHPTTILLRSQDGASHTDTRLQPPFHHPTARRAFFQAHAHSHEQELAVPELQPLLTDPSRYQFLVHLAAAVTQEAKADVEQSLGQPLRSYIPHNTFLVYATHAQAHAALDTEWVAWVGYYHPEHKLGVLNPSAGDPVPKRGHGLVASLAGHNHHDGHRLVDCDALSTRVQHLVHANVTFSCSRRRLTIEGLSSQAHIQQVATLLSRQHEVVSVQRTERHTTLNKWARGIVQSGVLSPDYSARDDIMSWRYGLDGAGQVVGCGDSGVDVDSCFFHDSSHPVPFKDYQRDANNKVTPQDLLHRTIVQYVTFADAVDDKAGHGSHVAGSILGYPENGADRSHDVYAGMAPKAKLAFFDIGQDNEEGELSLPNDLARDFFPWAYEAGARIHSNSWGSETPQYTPSSQDVDLFMWQHPDMLVLVAAGNSGRETAAGSPNGEYTIGSPATSKNCLAVGASVNSNAMFEEAYCTADVPDSQLEFPWGSTYCDFYVNSGYSRYFSENDLADFSSKGPTADGRIKPDVVAPGMFIVSAKSDPQSPGDCTEEASQHLIDSSGTSMSTPVLAGNLVLARQYFLDGFYPHGVRGSSPPLVPSGALLKAVAINAGVQLTGVQPIPDEDGRPVSSRSLGTIPNIYQGWGRTQLDTALSFADSALALLVFDTLQLVTGEEHEFVVDVVSGSAHTPLKATLVWTDYPATLSQANAELALVNDLDLVVTRMDTGSRRLGNGGTQRDFINPVEQVSIDDTTPTRYSITVTATNVPNGPQPYALVITGSVERAGGLSPPLETGAAGSSCSNEGEKKKSADGKNLVCSLVPGENGELVLRFVEKGGNGGKVAAGILIPLMLLLVAGVCYYYRATLRVKWNTLRPRPTSNTSHVRMHDESDAYEPPVGPVPVVSAALPAGWEEYTTDEGVQYYFNTATQQSQWTTPV